MYTLLVDTSIDSIILKITVQTMKKLYEIKIMLFTDIVVIIKICIHKHD